MRRLRIFAWGMILLTLMLCTEEWKLITSIIVVCALIDYATKSEDVERYQYRWKGETHDTNHRTRA